MTKTLGLRHASKFRLWYQRRLTRSRWRGLAAHGGIISDVGPQLQRHMDAIRAIDACAQRRQADELICARFDPTGKGDQSIALSEHGLSRLSDCIRFGSLAGCRFALGFKTVWGDRRGPALW